MSSLVLLAACKQSDCIRQSDCAYGLHCTESLTCEPDPTDDAGTDDAAAPLDMPPARDMAKLKTPCRDALRCYIFTRTFDRPKCLDALSPDDAARVHDEFVCVAGGKDRQGIDRGAACPIDCGRQLNSVELRDPNACWLCALTKLGNVCAETCQ